MPYIEHLGLSYIIPIGMVEVFHALEEVQVWQIEEFGVIKGSDVVFQYTPDFQHDIDLRLGLPTRKVVFQPVFLRVYVQLRGSKKECTTPG